MWRPDALGSICFLVSSWLAWAEECNGPFAWRPSRLSWQITALSLVYLFGVWAVLTGILAIVSAIQLRQAVANEVLLILFGIISVAAGVFVFFSPLFGVLALVWTISVYAILAGVFLIGLAFRLRSLPGAATGAKA